MNLEERYLAQSEVTRYPSSGEAAGSGSTRMTFLGTGFGKQGVVRNEKGEVCFQLNTEMFKLYPESNRQARKVFKHQMFILKLLKHLKIRKGTIPSLPFNK